MVKVDPGEIRSVGNMPSAHDGRPIMKQVRLTQKEQDANVKRFRDLRAEREAIQKTIESGPESDSVDQIKAEWKRLEEEAEKRLAPGGPPARDFRE